MNISLSFKRTLSIGLAAAIFVTQVALPSAAEANMWAERKRAVSGATPAALQLAALPAAVPRSIATVFNDLPSVGGQLSTMVTPTSRRLARLAAPLREVVGAVPLTHGRIQDVVDAGRRDHPPVVLVQDVHLNHEAQTNIAGILQSFIDAEQVERIGVEGAFGPFDFRPFRKFPRTPAARAVIDDLLRQHLIAAPSYVGLTSAIEPPVFVGVDDSVHYDANVAALHVARARAPEAERHLADIQRTLAERKALVFPTDLAAFDARRASFRRGEIGLGAYLTRLSNGEAETDIVVQRFLEAYAMESRLDFDRVERERRMVIENLAHVMTEAELSNLIATSVAYKAGRLGFGDYYEHLRDLCSEKGIALRKTLHFDEYIRYVLLSDGIKAADLFAAVRRLETARIIRLTRTAEERKLAQAGDLVERIEKLLSFSLTPDDWEAYNTFPPEVWALDVNGVSLSDFRADVLPPFEAFYAEADRRSRTMVETLLSDRSKKASVLVLGGFHAPLVSRLLLERGISHVTVSPRVTKLSDGAGSSYLSIFARDKAPLDRLFAGEKLFLASNHAAVGAAGAPALMNRLLEAQLSVLPENESSPTRQVTHEGRTYEARYSPGTPAPKAGFKAGDVAVVRLKTGVIASIVQGIRSFFGMTRPEPDLSDAGDEKRPLDGRTAAEALGASLAVYILFSWLTGSAGLPSGPGGVILLSFVVLFAAESLVIEFFVAADRWMTSRSAGPPLIPLWGSSARASSGTAFVRFDPDTDGFEVNPVLYALLTYNLNAASPAKRRIGFFVRLLTHAALVLLMVPVHESLHARGVRNEFVPASAQVVGWFYVGALVLNLGLWFPAAPLWLLAALPAALALLFGMASAVPDSRKDDVARLAIFVLSAPDNAFRGENKPFGENVIETLLAGMGSDRPIEERKRRGRVLAGLLARLPNDFFDLEDAGDVRLRRDAMAAMAGLLDRFDAADGGLARKLLKKMIVQVRPADEGSGPVIADDLLMLVDLQAAASEGVATWSRELLISLFPTNMDAGLGVGNAVAVSFVKRAVDRLSPLLTRPDPLRAGTAAAGLGAIFEGLSSHVKIAYARSDWPELNETVVRLVDNIDREDPVVAEFSLQATENLLDDDMVALLAPGDADGTAFLIEVLSRLAARSQHFEGRRRKEAVEYKLSARLPSSLPFGDAAVAAAIKRAVRRLILAIVGTRDFYLRATAASYVIRFLEDAPPTFWRGDDRAGVRDLLEKLGQDVKSRRNTTSLGNQSRPDLANLLLSKSADIFVDDTDAETAPLITEMVTIMLAALSDDHEDVRKGARASLATLLGRFPAFLTRDNLRSVIQGGFSGVAWFDDPVVLSAIVGTFGSSEDDDVRNAADAISKALADPSRPEELTIPATDGGPAHLVSLDRWAVSKALAWSASDEDRFDAVLSALAAAFRRWKGRAEAPVESPENEAAFWNVIALLIHHFALRPVEREGPRPIDVFNVAAAFVVTTLLAASAQAVLLNVDVLQDIAGWWGTSVFLWTPPVMFAVLLIVVVIFHRLPRSAGDPLPTGPPIIPLWGGTARPVAGTSFVRYDPDLKLYELNPVLFSLLTFHQSETSFVKRTSGVLVRFLTHVGLNLLQVRRHERDHAISGGGEVSAFFYQVVWWTLMAYVIVGFGSAPGFPLWPLALVPLSEAAWLAFLDMRAASRVDELDALRAFVDRMPRNFFGKRNADFVLRAFGRLAEHLEAGESDRRRVAVDLLRRLATSARQERLYLGGYGVKSAPVRAALRGLVLSLSDESDATARAALETLGEADYWYGDAPLFGGTPDGIPHLLQALTSLTTRFFMYETALYVQAKSIRDRLTNELPPSFDLTDASLKGALKANITRLVPVFASARPEARENARRLLVDFFDRAGEVGFDSTDKSFFVDAIARLIVHLEFFSRSRDVSAFGLARILASVPAGVFYGGDSGYLLERAIGLLTVQLERRALDWGRIAESIGAFFAKAPRFATRTSLKLFLSAAWGTDDRAQDVDLAEAIARFADASSEGETGVIAKAIVLAMGQPMSLDDKAVLARLFGTPESADRVFDLLKAAWEKYQDWKQSGADNPIQAAAADGFFRNVVARLVELAKGGPADSGAASSGLMNLISVQGPLPGSSLLNRIGLVLFIALVVSGGASAWESLALLSAAVPAFSVSFADSASARTPARLESAFGAAQTEIGVAVRELPWFAPALAIAAIGPAWMPGAVVVAIGLTVHAGLSIWFGAAHRFDRDGRRTTAGQKVVVGGVAFLLGGLAFLPGVMGAGAGAALLLIIGGHAFFNLMVGAARAWGAPRPAIRRFTNWLPFATMGGPNAFDPIDILAQAAKLAIDDQIRVLEEGGTLTDDQKKQLAGLREGRERENSRTASARYFIQSDLRREIDRQAGGDDAIWSDPDRLKALVTGEGYLANEWMMGVMFVLLHGVAGMQAIGLRFDDYRDILRGDLIEGETHFYSLVTTHAATFFRGVEPSALSEDDIEAIIGMSVELFRTAEEIMAQSDNLTDNAVTIRELIRFYVDFSLYYLRSFTADGAHNLGDVIRQFILTAENIYGRVLENPAARDEFAVALFRMLATTSKGAGVIFRAQQLKQFSSHGGPDRIRAIMNFADYETTEPDPDPTLSDFERAIDARIRRSRQTSRPLLFVTAPDDVMAVEDRLAALWTDDGRTVRFAASAFAKRKDLFGMLMPNAPLDAGRRETLIAAAEEEPGRILEALMAVFDVSPQAADLMNEMAENADAILADETVRDSVASYLDAPTEWRDTMSWRDGFLVEIARRAAEDPDNAYTIIVDNAEALPGRVRVLLNPVLWEKQADVPDRREKVRVPPNVQFIFTMDEDSVVRDDSFLNRVLVQFTSSFNLSKAGYLAKKTGVAAEMEPRLFGLLRALKAATWRDAADWSFSDLVHIGRRVGGRLADDPALDPLAVLAAEADAYLKLNLADRADWPAVEETLAGLRLNPPTQVPEIQFDADGRLRFDGVSLPTSEALVDFHFANPGESVETAFNRVYGFALTEMEERILCQLARDWAYGGRSVEIEGFSGEGKTEISRVFAKVIGLTIAERTVNAATDLGDLRGRFVSGRSGGIQFEEADYVREMEAGGFLHIFNEVNTSPGSRVYHWLYPEIAGYDEKALPEFSDPTGDRALRRVHPHPDNMRIFTVNADGTAGREPRPRRVGALVPRYRLSADPGALPALARQFFESDAALRVDAAFSPVLAAVHQAIWTAQNERNTLDGTQPVTRRFLLRVIERMKSLKAAAPGMSDRAAFGRAVKEIYTLPWKDLGDRDRAAEIVDAVLAKVHVPTPDAEPMAALRSSLREPSPTLVFQDASGPSGGDSVEAAIAEVDPSAAVVRVPLGFYHDAKQWVGAWMPQADGTAIDRLIRRLGGLRFQKLGYEIGLIGSMIAAARFRGAATTTDEAGSDWMYVVLENYTRLNEKTMPLLNEFLQTGELEPLATRISSEHAEALFDRIKAEVDEGTIDFDRLTDGFRPLPVSLDAIADDAGLRLEFAQWFYARRPPNLKIVATASSQEDVKIGGPELDRFGAVNISVRQNRAWIERTMAAWLDAHAIELSDRRRPAVINAVSNALAAYEAQAGAGDIDGEHVRLSVDDVNTFFAELLREGDDANADDALFADRLQRAAFYTFGIGLRPAYRERFGLEPAEMKNPADRIGYRKEAGRDRWIFFADGIEIETRYPADAAAPSPPLALTENHVRQMAALIVAWRHKRWSIIEGPQGGGKSALVPAFAHWIGVPHDDELMYDGIDLGGFLGRLSVKGGDLILTALPDKDGRFVLKFLNAYQNGGAINLDEGAVGASAQKVIEFLASLAARPTLDLSHYHPGYAGPVLTRHPDFRLFVTQNPAGVTKDRLGIPYEADARAHKIWADNTLSFGDALLIIDHHIGPAYVGSGETPEIRKAKDLMARIHLEFLERHPAKEELSPRQLILMALGLKDALARPGASETDMRRAVFRAAMVAYFERLALDERKALGSVLGELVMEFSHEWLGAIAASPGDFGGIPIAVSSGRTNVEPGEIRFAEALSSQNGAMRAVAYGLSLGMPVALLEAVGADALDLVRKVAARTDRELEILWSHGDMTRSHLVDALVPLFEPAFDAYGVRRQDDTRAFRQALGFLTRHMMPRAEYEALPKKDRYAEKILFFHMMDAIPERQRVILNLFLSRMGEKRMLTVEDAEGRPVDYVLPPWVGLVVSAPVDHRFSSPFMNRFLPVRVEPFSYDEWRTLIHRRYPYVDDREFEWLWKIQKKAVEMDRAGHFEVGYGFSPEDILKLASALQDVKRRNFRPLKQDPLYYAIRAVQLVYLGALKDEDLATFERSVILPLLRDIFRMPLSEGRIDVETLAAYYALLKSDVFAEFAHIETQTVTKAVPLADLSETDDVVLSNGFRLKLTDRSSGKLTLTTPARSYPLTINALKNGLDVTDEIRASLDASGDNIILAYDVMKSVGGFDLPQDPWNVDRALPVHETPTQAFMEMTPEHAIFLSGVFNAWQTRADKTQAPGEARSPRVMMINGETGVAKTAGMVNAALVTGIPLYVLNSYEDMRVADVTMSMGVEQGKIQMDVKELLARIGKIRPKGSNGAWRKIRIPGKTTASRVIVAWDEANVATALAHPLAPLFRGEKRFDIAYLGEVWEVDVEDEVLLALTFNPAETYGDRASFPAEITGYAHKAWPANPARYPDGHLKTILEELTRRGVRSVHEAMERRSGPPAAAPETDGHVDHERNALSSSHPDTAEMDAEAERRFVGTLKRFDSPEVSDEWRRAIEDRLRRAGWSADGGLPEAGDEDAPVEGAENDEEEAGAEPARATHEFELDYDLADLKTSAASFKASIPDVVDYGRRVIAPFLQAVSDLRFTEDEPGHAPIAGDVFATAAALDPRLETALRAIFEMYLTGRVIENELHENIMVVRRVLTAPGRDAYLIARAISESPDQAPYIFVTVERIVSRFEDWTVDQYDRLGIDSDSPLRAEPLPQTLVLDQAPSLGILGYWEGEFAVAFQGEIERVTADRAPIGDAVAWTALHEIGHMIDQRRYRAESFPIPDNIELNSMLMPMVFGEPVGYLNHLRERMQGTPNPEDVYGQAVKGILNGLRKLLLESQPVDGPVPAWIETALGSEGLAAIAAALGAPGADLARSEGVEWVTDQFESDRVDAIIDVLVTLPPALIQTLAAEIYQRRAAYLSTAKPGSVNAEVSGGSGWMKEFTAGIDKGYPEKITSGPDQDIKIESQSKKDRPTFRPEPQARRDGKGGRGSDPRTDPDDATKGEADGEKGEGGKGEGEKGDGSGADGETPDGAAASGLDIPHIPAPLLRKFMSLFAGAPAEVRFLSEEGEEIDMNAFAASRGFSDFFVRVQPTRQRTRGYFAVSVDISGSTRETRTVKDPETGKPVKKTINQLFVEMARQFIALFHRAAVKNSEVQTALAIHGDAYTELLPAKDSHKPAKVKAAIGDLSRHPANEGNDFQGVIQSIIDKHERNNGFPILEIVIVDGLVSVDESLLAEAHQKGIDIVIIGYGTPDVLQFPKSVNLPAGTDAAGMLKALVRIAEVKANRRGGKLPYGDQLAAHIGLAPGGPLSSSETDARPIDRGGALAATLIAATIAGGAFAVFWALGALPPLTPILVSPALFGALTLSIAGLRRLGRSAGERAESEPPVIRLWGRTGRPLAGIDFVAYDPATDGFLLHPTLYALLAPISKKESIARRGLRVLGRLTAHTLLIVMLVPLHEYLHAGGEDDELIPFGAQALGWFLTAAAVELAARHAGVSAWGLWAVPLALAFLWAGWETARATPVAGKERLIALANDPALAPWVVKTLTASLNDPDAAKRTASVDSLAEILRGPGYPAVEALDEGTARDLMDRLLAGLKDEASDVRARSATLLEVLVRSGRANAALTENGGERLNRLLEILVSSPDEGDRSIRMAHTPLLLSLFQRPIPENRALVKDELLAEAIGLLIRRMGHRENDVFRIAAILYSFLSGAQPERFAGWSEAAWRKNIEALTNIVEADGAKFAAEEGAILKMLLIDVPGRVLDADDGALFRRLAATAWSVISSESHFNTGRTAALAIFEATMRKREGELGERDRPLWEATLRKFVDQSYTTNEEVRLATLSALRLLLSRGTPAFARSVDRDRRRATLLNLLRPFGSSRRVDRGLYGALRDGFDAGVFSDLFRKGDGGKVLRETSELLQYIDARRIDAPERLADLLMRLVDSIDASIFDRDDDAAIRTQLRDLTDAMGGRPGDREALVRVVYRMLHWHGAVQSNGEARSVIEKAFTDPKPTSIRAPDARGGERVTVRIDDVGLSRFFARTLERESLYGGGSGALAALWRKYVDQKNQYGPETADAFFWQSLAGYMNAFTPKAFEDADSHPINLRGAAAAFGVASLVGLLIGAILEGDFMAIAFVPPALFGLLLVTVAAFRVLDRWIGHRLLTGPPVIPLWGFEARAVPGTDFAQHSPAAKAYHLNPVLYALLSSTVNERSRAKRLAGFVLRFITHTVLNVFLVPVHEWSHATDRHVKGMTEGGEWFQYLLQWMAWTALAGAAEIAGHAASSVGWAIPIWQLLLIPVLPAAIVAGVQTIGLSRANVVHFLDVEEILEGNRPWLERELTALLGRLKNGNASIRLNAAGDLGVLLSPLNPIIGQIDEGLLQSIMAALVERLRDENGDVRSDASRALRNFYKSLPLAFFRKGQREFLAQHIETLIENLSDANSDVRSLHQIALQQCLAVATLESLAWNKTRMDEALRAVLNFIDEEEPIDSEEYLAILSKIVPGSTDRNLLLAIMTFFIDRADGGDPMLGWEDSAALIRLFDRLPDDFFQVDDRAWINRAITVLIEGLAREGKDTRKNFATAFHRITSMFPEAMDQKNLGAILRSWGEELPFGRTEMIDVIGRFSSFGNTATVRSAASAITKAITEDPPDKVAALVNTEALARMFGKAAVADSDSLFQFLQATWEKYQDWRENPALSGAAEGFFWNAIVSYVEANHPRPADADNEHPINLRGAAAAFVVSLAASAVLGVPPLWSGPFDDSRRYLIGALGAAVPAVFAALLVVVGGFRFLSPPLESRLAAGPRIAPLWGDPALAVSGVDFVRYNDGFRGYEVNPLLFWLLNYNPSGRSRYWRSLGAAVRLTAHALLYLLAVPVHEGFHAFSEREWVAYGMHAVMIWLSAMMAMCLPLMMNMDYPIPLFVAVIAAFSFGFGALAAQRGSAAEALPWLNRYFLFHRGSAGALFPAYVETLISHFNSDRPEVKKRVWNDVQRLLSLDRAAWPESNRLKLRRLLSVVFQGGAAASANPALRQAVRKAFEDPDRPNAIAIGNPENGTQAVVTLSDNNIVAFLKEYAFGKSDLMLDPLRAVWEKYEDLEGNQGPDVADGFFWRALGALLYADAKEAVIDPASNPPSPALEAGRLGADERLEAALNDQSRSDPGTLKRRLLAIVDDTPLKLELDRLAEGETTGTALGDVAEVVSRRLADRPAELRRFGDAIRFVLTGEAGSDRAYFGGSLNGLMREIRRPVASPAKDFSRPQIIIQLTDDAVPDHTLALARNEIRKAGNGEAPIIFRFMTGNARLRDQLADLANEAPANVTIEAHDIGRAGSLSLALESGVVTHDELRTRLFRFIAPDSMKGRLASFLDFDAIEGVDFTREKDRFRIYLMLTDTLNPLTVELEHDRLRDLDGLIRLVRTILQQA